MADKEKKTENKAASTAVARAYASAGKELMKLGEVALALKTCERGIARFPKYSNIYVFKGEIYIALFNRDKKPDYAKAALSSFNEAIKLDPNNYLAKLISAQLYLKGGVVKKAKQLVTSILETDSSDERAKSMLVVIDKAEAAKAAKAKPKEKEEKKGAEEEEEELIISDNLASSAGSEEVVIGSSIDEDEEHMQETLASKLSILSRLDGLLGLFLVDANGQPFKVINKAKLDENVIPSFIFNLSKATANAVRRCGMGSFQTSTLVSPIGTMILANAYYATLAVIVENDADMDKIDKRIQRYLSEVTG